MRLQKKSGPDRVLDTVGDSLAALGGGLNRSKLVKAGLIAGGAAVLTAGSAAISELRRRSKGDS